MASRARGNGGGQGCPRAVPAPQLNNLILTESLNIKYTVLAANAQCQIRLPFILFSILSVIMWWTQCQPSPDYAEADTIDK